MGAISDFFPVQSIGDPGDGRCWVAIVPTWGPGGAPDPVLARDPPQPPPPPRGFREMVLLGMVAPTALGEIFRAKVSIVFMCFFLFSVQVV